eukprot:2473793-Rhodomonas_salina.1
MTKRVAGSSLPSTQEKVSLSEPRQIAVQMWLACDLKAADAEEGVGGAETNFCLRCNAKQCDKSS